MSAKSKKIIKKLISWSGILFFILAAMMLFWQLRHYSLRDIGHALWNIPHMNLLYAAVACVLGYISLSIYDYLALKYVGKKVTWWKWMLAGMIGFSISNNAGHAVVSGGAIRYRLYTRWRISGGEILKMLTFSGFTYFLGASAVVIIGYFIVPHELFSQSVGANVGVNALFVFCCASVGAYFAMTFFFRNKKIKIGSLEFKVPRTYMAIAQMLLGIADSVLAGLVLYFCLIPYVDIPFHVFIGTFIIAQTAGVFSQVPGGIGVFETLFMLVLPADVNRATIFGALLAYRIIYYVLPLICTGSAFFIYENYLRTRMKRWIEEAKALKQRMPHIPNLHEISEKMKARKNQRTENKNPMPK